jgi:DNA-binding response OmpR family regulator
MDAADVLEAYLRRDSFDVLIAENGTKGLEMARRLKPDLILLDIMLPGISGTEVLASIRRDSDVPVIMVTAMGRRRNVLAHCAMALTILLLSLIFPGEVVARVQAVLRRTARAENPKRLNWQNLSVNTVAITAIVTDREKPAIVLDLTPSEFSMLTTLMRHPTRPFTRQFLLEQCLPDSDALERVVDTHIYNLRKN